jgi:hypothetical protein
VCSSDLVLHTEEGLPVLGDPGKHIDRVQLASHVNLLATRVHGKRLVELLQQTRELAGLERRTCSSELAVFLPVAVTETLPSETALKRTICARSTTCKLCGTGKEDANSHFMVCEGAVAEALRINDRVTALLGPHRRRHWDWSANSSCKEDRVVEARSNLFDETPPLMRRGLEWETRIAARLVFGNLRVGPTNCWDDGSTRKLGRHLHTLAKDVDHRVWMQLRAPWPVVDVDAPMTASEVVAKSVVLLARLTTNTLFDTELMCDALSLTPVPTRWCPMTISDCDRLLGAQSIQSDTTSMPATPASPAGAAGRGSRIIVRLLGRGVEEMRKLSRFVVNTCRSHRSMGLPLELALMVESPSPHQTSLDAIVASRTPKSVRGRGSGS